MLWHCMTCTTRYAESLDACPQCGSTERRAAHEVDDEWARESGENEEGDMPKIYADGRPASNAAEAIDEAVPTVATEPEVAETVTAAPESATEQVEAPAEPVEEEPAEEAAAVESTVAETPERPGAKAPKTEWVAYRVAQGADRESAEAMTKADLADDANFSEPEG